MLVFGNIRRLQQGVFGVITFLKAEAGAISAPLSVRRRNMGHEDAFILKPKHREKEKS